MTDEPADGPDPGFLSVDRPEPRGYFMAADEGQGLLPWSYVDGRLAAARNYWIATAGPVGHSPFAPGTFGPLLGLPLAWGIGQIPWPWLELGTIVVICAVGVPICGAAAARLGAGKDPGSIVLDEVAALPIVFFLVKADGPMTILAGFAFFRLFDIVKPPPARQAERLPGGVGIMADDWIAAVYANLALQLLVWLKLVGVTAG